jgi:hypothetical protein
VLCVALAVAQAATASAAGQIQSFSATASASQAGGHPDLGISLSIANPGAPETAKTLTLEMPAGLTGYFNSVPHCSLADLATAECASDSQVGLATTHAFHEGDPDFLLGTAPLYAVSPTGSGGYGRLAFTIPTLGFTQSMIADVRSGGDYGIQLTAPDLPGSAPLQALGLTLWGLPFDPVHDQARFPPGSEGCPGLSDASCNTEPTASDAAEKPLVGYPPSCGVQPLPLTLTLQTYEDQASPTTASASLPAPTGCGFLAFNPSTFVQMSPSSRTRTFFELDLRVPQPASPVPTSSSAKSAFIDTGGALRLDRAAAQAHAVCSEAEAGIGTETPPACPAAAKIGSVRIDTAVAPEALGGSASGAARTRVAIPQIAGSAYFGGVEGEGYRVYLLPTGFGVNVKLLMLLQPDPQTGSLIVSLPSMPQLPLAEIELNLPAGRGVLETAIRCGGYLVTSTVTPWSAPGSSAVANQPLQLSTGPGGTPCPGAPAQARLALTPSQVIADGRSTTTATAVVTDEGEIPVPGEEVELTSTDPEQQIGPVIDNEDGTYSARIRASTAVGSATITATVKSAEPELSVSALLRQLSPTPPATPSSSSPAERKAAIPKVRIGKHPPRRTRRHRAVFTFSADVRGSVFFCKIDGSAYRRCPSPTKLSGLAVGRHRFSVYAVGPNGSTGVPASVRFTVLPPKRRAG